MLLVAICCAWVLGIFLGSIYHFPLALIFIGLIPLPFVFFFRELRKYLILSALCLATLFGAAFYFSTQPGSSQIASFNNQGIAEIKGVIDAPPDVKDTITHVELSVREVKIKTEWHKTQGKILLFISRYPRYQYGD